MFVLISANAAPPLSIPGVFGQWLLDPAQLFFSAALLPAPCSGTTAYTFPAPTLAPSLLGAPLCVQSLFADATLSFLHLGPSTHLLVLDASL